ncbi:MAG: ATP-binding protein [candidate division WOR-3 bacterium]|nr:ATP-binding protein [candidate division WOR-3 bacterium]
MLEDNDRLVIAFSGGKDSMLLLNFFLDNPIVNELLVIHIDPGFGEKTKAIRDYLESKGVDFVIHKLNIRDEIPKSSESPCFICSHRRREYLFRIALENNYKKIAFGHNRDDIVVTFLMNLFFHGEVSTSLPVQEFFGGKIEIIRPLYFLWEDWITNITTKMGLPLLSGECPYQGKNKRNEIKELIELYPHTKANLYRALFNIKKDYLP